MIFWSEANACVLPDQRGAFMQRAAAFARQHQVCFMPACQILRYGDTSGLNGLALVTPEGELTYEYEKTLSWYATASDGVIDSLQTPCGRIGAAICFDMDAPAHIRQAARQGVDIMLVPAPTTAESACYAASIAGSLSREWSARARPSPSTTAAACSPRRTFSQRRAAS